MDFYKGTPKFKWNVLEWLITVKQVILHANWMSSSSNKMNRQINKQMQHNYFFYRKDNGLYNATLLKLL